MKISLDDRGLISQTIEIVKTGVRVVRVYPDSVVSDTFTIQQWISIPCVCGTKEELDQYNRSLQMINELMKTDD